MASRRVELTVVAALLANAVAWGQPGQIGSRRGVTPMRDASAASSSGSSNPNNIQYNRGAVLPNTTTYAIFWGNPADFPQDASSAVFRATG